MGVDWRTIPDHRPGSELAKGFGYLSASIGIVAVFALAGIGVASAQYESSSYIQKEEGFSDDVLLSDREREPDPVPGDRQDGKEKVEAPKTEGSKRKENTKPVVSDIPKEPRETVLEDSVEEVVEDDEDIALVDPEEEPESSDDGFFGDVQEQAPAGETHYSGDQFKFEGRVYEGEHEYTWYSEDVLPGEGLGIPGRHVDDEGYVRDGDGNLCVASNGYSYGSVIDVPFGDGKAVVYDSCEDEGDELIDVYVSW